MPDDQFAIRRAEIVDAPIIARHRARMFQEMGELPAERFEALRASSQSWLEKALESGEYMGWLLIRQEISEVSIAGAGVHRRRVAPHPADDLIAEGRHGVVINVFTEPEWRRRGLARRLMECIVEWAKAESLDRLILHASNEARLLYERLGFVATNEMRYTGHSCEARVK